MRFLRSATRSAVLLALLLAARLDGQCRCLFLGLRAGPAGAVCVHGWCRRIIRCLRLPCFIDGPVPAVDGRSLAVVSNHLSYLDILLYSAVRPFVMVAKSEVRCWPLIGWITAQAGTVYVQRADVKGGRTQSRDEVNAAMAEAFRSGLPVLFFPEGTTSNGESVLPFRRGLFNAVVFDRVAVRTAAVAYSLAGVDTGTSIADHVCFWGDMIFGPHVFRCMGVRGLQAHVCFGERELTSGDRFQLSRLAEQEVEGLYDGLRRELNREEMVSGSIEAIRPLDVQPRGNGSFAARTMNKGVVPGLISSSH